MSKELKVNCQTGEITERELTTAEENTRATEHTASRTAQETAEQEKADLKASAKAKLIAGEALTEDEANELVGL
tara:strand:- start:59 stop:280 length:222 start_codon:yes stop_codon:yes gene_type:complete